MSMAHRGQSREGVMTAFERIDHRELKRKLKEVVLARRIEARFALDLKPVP